MSQAALPSNIAVWSAKRRSLKDVWQKFTSIIQPDIVVLTEIKDPVPEVAGYSATSSLPSDHLPSNERKLLLLSKRRLDSVVVRERLIIAEDEAVRVVAVLPPYKEYGKNRGLAPWQGYREWWDTFPDFQIDRPTVVAGDFNFKLSKAGRSWQATTPFERLGSNFEILTAGSQKLDHAAVSRHFVAPSAEYLPAPFDARDDRPILRVSWQATTAQKNGP